ncbi:DUF4328 domain-containing protein [Streptomyces sp. VRA16 Mangrove soil]|uniref:DUF4328 domain-containing protein n=1 Tax=Streptomyces sp. VRA16 Mangrove soil TaxID=2817434 RepID=UPI001A9EC41A|nr:DUF4328 domain-containing protein [Streptomyces sp. VRA16 Mangrove soil]MBO1336522.1 DUF4328 domain-containing protein [Streptomyces sp. VRA16 Mangrove soil]
MECTRCRAAFVGADGRCPRCDGSPQQSAPDPYAPPSSQPPQAPGAPYGQAPYGQTPYAGRPGYGQAQAPQGQTPYGQAPYGQDPYGQAPQGQDPYGQAPQGQAPYGQAPYGQAPGMYPPPAAPHAPYGMGPGMMPPRPPARLSGLSTAVTVLFAVMAVLALLRVVADYRLYDALGSIWTTDLAEAESIDDFRRISILLLFLGFLAAAPVFLVWFYKARANAEGLAPGRLRHSRGMAIGAWFIPFANWWIPKAMADDIAAASQGTPRPTGLGVINAWWACWVVSSVLAGFGWPMYASAMDDHNPSLEGARTASLILMGSNLALLAAAVCGLLMVRAVSALQDARPRY